MKASFIPRIAAVLVFIGLLAAVCVRPAAAGTLDGKTFTGTIGEQDKAGDPDNFIFADGTFRSTACGQYGYIEAPYTVSEEAGKTTFSVTTRNNSGATMAWQGIVNDESIEGTAVMTAKDGKAQTFWFKGEKQP
jgi:hypothetical protein